MLRILIKEFRTLNPYIGYWTFWFKREEGDSELIDEPYRIMRIHAQKRAKEIANETDKIVTIFKTKSTSENGKEMDIYPDKQ